MTVGETLSLPLPECLERANLSQTAFPLAASKSWKNLPFKHNSCRIQIMGLESRTIDPLWLKRSHGPRVPGHQQKPRRLSGDMIRMLEERTALVQKRSEEHTSELQSQ